MNSNFSDDRDPPQALQAWLDDKPFEWGPALATRACLRSLPSSLEECSPEWIERNLLPTFHGLIVAWTTISRPIKGHKFAAELSSNLLYQAALSHEFEAFYASAVRSLSLAISAKQKAIKVDKSTRSIASLINLERRRSEQDAKLAWRYVEQDAAILDISATSKNVFVKRLMRKPLLHGDAFAPFEARINATAQKVTDLDPTFKLWFDWLTRAVRGSDLNFLEVGDPYGTEGRDRTIAINIVQELTPTFWGRAPAIVNGEIAKWIETAKSEASFPEDVSGATVPPQNENAIAFRTGDDGKIALSGHMYLDTLRRDQESTDRYFECLELAKDLLKRCSLSNSASRLSHLLENYLSAAGDTADSMRPSLFVQRGERLRQELAAYQSHDTFLPALADDMLLDLRAWQGAHNMLVGLDPALMARDLALVGPDSRSAIVPPDELRALARDADSEGLLAGEVIEVMLEATRLAPDVPDPLNRRTIWSFETGRNLVIEAFNLALSHPREAAIGGVVTATAITSLGLSGAVLGAAAFAIPASNFLLRNRAWIETRLGDSPTWRGLFLSLCEYLDQNVPPNERRG